MSRPVRERTAMGVLILEADTERVVFVVVAMETSDVKVRMSRGYVSGTPPTRSWIRAVPGGGVHNHSYSYFGGVTFPRPPSLKAANV